MKMPTGEPEPFFKQPERVVIPQLAILPAEVQALFLRLTPDTQDVIFPQTRAYEFPATHKHHEGTQERMIASFDRKTREQYAASLFSELFVEGGVREIFRPMYLDHLELNIERFMDLLWSNRNNLNTQPFQTFGAAHYLECKNNFEKTRQERQVLERLIEEKRVAVKAQLERIEVTKRQKRLTERKQAELSTIQAELEKAVSTLESFNRMKGSPQDERIRLQRLEERKNREQQVTQSIQLVTQYLDADEFATVVSERFDDVFSDSIRVSKGPQEGTRFHFSESQVFYAKELVALLQRAIGDWHMRHRGEGSIKAGQELNLNQKQLKMIDHFLALFASYSRCKKDKEVSDESLIIEIADMRVALNLLGRSADQK